jgi:hypothetical protein
MAMEDEAIDKLSDAFAPAYLASTSSDNGLFRDFSMISLR